MTTPGRQVNVYNVADIFITLAPSASSPKSAAYKELGTTRDGVGLTSDGYFLEIKNDESGGEAGPPVEIQYLGETAKIRIELTKYDPVTAALVEDHCQCTTNGTPAAPGTFMFTTSTIQVGSGGAIGLAVACGAPQSTPSTTPFATGTTTRVFNRVVLHDSVEVNRGTKFSTFVLTATAYKDANGAVWADITD